MGYNLPSWIENKFIPEPNSGCWLWLGALDGKGYGEIKLGRKNGKSMNYRAHRMLYEIHTGAPIANEMVLDHICRVRCCVNPEHLEVVTSKTNILRGMGLSAQNARKLVCDNGHSLADAYLVSGGRKCRVCQSALMARYYQRRKNNQ